MLYTELKHMKESVKIRYEHIEKRLEEGSEKFKRIEVMLWGLYGVIAMSMGLSQYLS